MLSVFWLASYQRLVAAVRHTNTFLACSIFSQQIGSALEWVFVARHKLTTAEQIRGLKKALKNPRTPKAFRAGMQKRLAKLER